MKEYIKITVFKADLYKYDLPKTPKDFLAWWEDKFNQIPEQYRDDAIIDCPSAMYLDSSLIPVELYYIREETQEEEFERIKEEHRLAEEEKNKDLRELKRIKDKYEL